MKKQKIATVVFSEVGGILIAELSYNFFMSYQHTPITYITDCRDDNTQGRLKARVSTLFEGGNVIFMGVDFGKDAEAAINVVDVLDAYDGEPGVMLVNVAPRSGGGKKWENGTPFGHLKYDNVDIFTTIDGHTMSLLQKVAGEKLSIDVYEIPEVVPHMDVDEVAREKIINTQFRSFNYLPRLARDVMYGKDLPVSWTFDEIPDMPMMTCWIDTFGNIKTNILPEEIGFEVGKSVIIRVSENKQLLLPCYDRLKDIPDGVAAVTVGSSGYKDKRFIEIMLQGASAAYQLGIGSGAELEYVSTK